MLRLSSICFDEVSDGGVLISVGLGFGVFCALAGSGGVGRVSFRVFLGCSLDVIRRICGCSSLSLRCFSMRV